MQQELLSQITTLPRAQFIAQHPQMFFVYGVSAHGFKTGYFPSVAPRGTQSVAATVRVPIAGAVMLGAEGAPRGILVVAKSERNLLRDSISIGRAPTCDMCLPVINVSKIHAQFLREPSGRWAIRDAESTNGTFINGQKAIPGIKVTLKPGDTIRLAHCEGRFLDAELLFDLLR